MRLLLSVVLVLSSGLLAQETIPAGTVLPAQLNSSLDSRKSKPGQVITARLMQDVPLAARGKIPAGAKVLGHIINVVTAGSGRGARITLAFDTVKFATRSLRLTTNLRALASMMEVEDAQVPPAGTDRGTPWAWRTTNQIGGEIVYGEGGPVTNGSEVVGHAVPGGVLVWVRARPGARCRGPIDGNERPQALWIFSSDACGLYGFSDLEIIHAGRTSPLGQIVLESRQGPVRVSGGSGLLLRVNAP